MRTGPLAFVIMWILYLPSDNTIGLNKHQKSRDTDPDMTWRGKSLDSPQVNLPNTNTQTKQISLPFYHGEFKLGALVSASVDEFWIIALHFKRITLQVLILDD